MTTTNALVEAADTKIEGLANLEELYDTTAGYDEEVGVRLAEGLSPEDILRAKQIYNLFNGLWGLCIVVGDPGSGKDLFSNYITYRIKMYFPHKRIMRDEKPRVLYGPYAGLFNEETLQLELAKMREIARGLKGEQVDVALQRAADVWVSSKGEVLLKNAVLYLVEFWRYCYNREPHNPMNKTMGGIHKQKRHLDCLILGTVQLVTDLDKKTCLPFVDWKVTCTRSRTNKTRFTYFVEKVKWDKRMEELIVISRPFPISIDAGKPRSYMGDGKIVLRKPRYIPETEEERIVLDVIKAGASRYEDIVEILETEGDMSEWEVLTTLKELKFRLRKRAVEYPCDFGLYNSKSAPQMRSTVRVLND
jgi:hypothetical protein